MPRNVGILKVDGCHIWQGSTTKNGYARTSPAGRYCFTCKSAKQKDNYAIKTGKK